MQMMLRCFAIPILFTFGFAKAKAHEISFYGKSIAISAVSLENPQLKGNPNLGDLQAFQSKIQKTEWESVLEELNREAKKMDLDDYGTFNLLKSFVLKHAKGSIYTKKALVHAGLRMNGLDANIAVKGNFLEIYICMKQHTDYGYSYTKNGKVYFSTNPSGVHPNRMRVLEDTFYQHLGRRAFAMNLKKLPKLGTEIKRRSVHFNKYGRSYNSEIKYNKHYVDYLNDMPALQLGSHLLESAIENHLFTQLDDSMNVWTQNMSDQEKRNFLLHMVQYAFPYKADADYRKHEKRNTVAQSLADDFIDCEDKAVMFLFLAKRYTKANGIMLYNKNKKHVNCAIEMPENAAGYTFKYKGKKYLIAEPAYEGYDMAETDFTQADILDSKVFFTE